MLTMRKSWIPPRNYPIPARHRFVNPSAAIPTSTGGIPKTLPPRSGLRTSTTSPPPSNSLLTPTAFISAAILISPAPRKSSSGPKTNPLPERSSVKSSKAGLSSNYPTCSVSGINQVESPDTPATQDRATGVLRFSKMRQRELLLIGRFLVGGTSLCAGVAEAQTPDRILAFDSEVQSQNFSIRAVLVRTG